MIKPLADRVLLKWKKKRKNKKWNYFINRIKRKTTNSKSYRSWTWRKINDKVEEMYVKKVIE